MFCLPTHFTLPQAEALKEALLAQLDPELTIDCAAVEQVDTAGLQLLLALQRHCAQAGRTVRLVNYHPLEPLARAAGLTHALWSSPS